MILDDKKLEAAKKDLRKHLDLHRRYISEGREDSMVVREYWYIHGLIDSMVTLGIMTRLQAERYESIMCNPYQRKSPKMWK